MTDKRLLDFARRVYNELPCACGPIEEAGVCACPIAEAGVIIDDLESAQQGDKS
ncbi:hypothetical protein LCGC14_1424480 [marine sediment metagenome]|uniref:Uncharacterized protein n=1 Tax=marine sediment metagenome TaxID=412755 RepID=A0A0F9MS45_9ZZZZ